MCAPLANLGGQLQRYCAPGKKKRPGGLVHSFRCWPGQSRRHVPLRHACCVVMAFAGLSRRCPARAGTEMAGQKFSTAKYCRVRVLLSIYLPACLGKEKASALLLGNRPENTDGCGEMARGCGGYGSCVTCRRVSTRPPSPRAGDRAGCRSTSGRRRPGDRVPQCG